MTPKPETEITTEVTNLKEKTESQPEEKPNVLPMTQMPFPIPKRTFCRFMILSNAVRCFQIADNPRNNHVENGNKMNMTPKPKTTITTEAAILEEKTENHPPEKPDVLPMTAQLSNPKPKPAFCRFMIRNFHLRPSSIIKCHREFPKKQLRSRF